MELLVNAVLQLCAPRKKIKRSRVLSGMEVVYEGWLVKSPPERRIRRAKWRRRWFVLRPSGDVPQQYVLEYYTDQSYKKLKGTIDLDQCDQVDAGLDVDAKSKFVFDIKTSKRTYYLVADSEDVMNKWVDCICKVCGLRMQVEDDVSSASVEATSPSTEPQQQQPTAVDSHDDATLEQVVPSLDGSRDSSTSKEDSNPYIPISECITGKPVSNGLNGDVSLRIPPPRSPVMSQPTNSVQGYGVLHRAGDRTSPDPVMESLCRIPRAPLQKSDDVDGMLVAVPPPRVNWTTHPKNDGDTSNGQVLNYDRVPPARPVSGGSDGSAAPPYDGDTLGRAGLKIKPRGAIAPPRPPKSRNSVEESYDYAPPARPVETNESRAQGEGELIPPRPPKPANIRNRPGTAHDTYDIPPPPSLSHAVPQPGPSQDGYDVPPPVSSHPQPRTSQDGYDVPKPVEQSSFNFRVSSTMPKVAQETYDIPKTTESPSPLSRQPLPQPPRQLTDSAYDFPKMGSPEVLSATVPAPGTQRRMHFYCNAPTGMFSNRETIFNYEYRPSLCSSETHVAVGEESGTADVPPLSASYADLTPSPETPNLAAVPPAVNRGLKPRKASEGSAPSIFPLAPAPIARNRSFTSFTKTRLHKGDGTGYHDEDSWSNTSGSRRNSTNEEQAARQEKKRGEIQYLDLDLDAETGQTQSPRSPERVTTSATVYRTVDFLKTKAFNRTRQNVEESYRSHKDGEPCK